MFYLANYCSTSDADAIRDDGVQASDLAYPSGMLLLARDEVNIAAMLNTVWEQLTSAYAVEDRDEPDPDWTTEGWKGDDIYGIQTWYSSAMETTLILRSITPLLPAGPE